MLDRLLGANNTTPGTVGPHGLYYQWGRKDPMIGVSIIGQFSSSEDESETEIGGAATATSSVNKTFVPDWYYDDSNEETKTHQEQVPIQPDISPTTTTILHMQTRRGRI